jgi:hypothetical protein
MHEEKWLKEVELSAKPSKKRVRLMKVTNLKSIP